MRDKGELQILIKIIFPPNAFSTFPKRCQLNFKSCTIIDISLAFSMYTCTRTCTYMLC